MNTLPQADTAKQATVINIATRQPMDTTKPKRGGKRDPLPRLTITIPNYGKYQQKAKRRDWAAVHKGIGRDSRMVQACERGLTPLAVFCVLLTLADNEGVIADVRAKDLSLEMCGIDPRTILSGLDALASVGIISKQEANTEQALSKQSASTEQTVSVQSLQEDPSNDAALSAPTRQDKDKTEQDNTPLPPEGAAVPTDAIVHWVPTSDGKPYPITAAKCAEWKAAFPTVPLDDEMPSAIQWARDNPKKAPTYSGATRYMGNWLRRCADHQRTQSQLSIGGLANGTGARTQGNRKPLGADMGRHRTTQPGSIYDLEL